MSVGVHILLLLGLIISPTYPSSTRISSTHVDEQQSSLSVSDVLSEEFGDAIKHRICNRNDHPDLLVDWWETFDFSSRFNISLVATAILDAILCSAIYLWVLPGKPKQEGVDSHAQSKWRRAARNAMYQEAFERIRAGKAREGFLGRFFPIYRRWSESIGRSTSHQRLMQSMEQAAAASNELLGAGSAALEGKGAQCPEVLSLFKR